MNKIFKYILVFTILFCTLLTAPSASVRAEETTEEQDGLYWPVAPELVSKAAILMDADTGAILYEKNSRERNYPASTTKILTGLLVCRNAGLSEQVVFSKEAANSVEYGDATLSTKEGEIYTVEQALYGLLLYSANEIAYALAEHVSGSYDSFIDLMNKTVEELGATDTHFANASGLYDDNHYSTAYDMALIARMCFNNPTFLTIDSTAKYEIPATNKTNEERVFFNRNLLLPERPYGYEYCVGGKTGYLPEGGYTYVSYAEKDGMRLIFVGFNSTADDRFADAKKSFEWGFENFTKVTLTGSTLTAAYSDASFLSSKRYNGNNITKAFDSSFVTLPNSAQLSDTTISKDPNNQTVYSANSITVPLVFSYGDHTVGTASLSYNATTLNDTGSGLLPVKKTTDSVEYKTKKAFVIDLRILIGIGVALLIIYIIYAARKNAQRKKQIPKWKKNKYY